MLMEGEQNPAVDVTIEEFVVSDGDGGPVRDCRWSQRCHLVHACGCRQDRAARAGSAPRTYALPNPKGQPTAIAPGPDGSMWFTQTLDNSIGRITPAGDFAIFGLPTPGASPAGLAVGPDGALWFTEMTADHIGRISIEGLVTEYPLPVTGGYPAGIVTAR